MTRVGKIFDNIQSNYNAICVMLCARDTDLGKTMSLRIVE